MRIIDKNYDFYDYLQDYTDTIVFDRRNSFLMTREMLLREMFINRKDWGNEHCLLLQCGARYWLFLVEFIKFEHAYPTDFTIELLHTWVNHNKPRVIIKMNIVDPPYSLFKTRNIKGLQQAIHTNDWRYRTDINTNITWVNHKNSYEKIYQDMPLLKACGLSDLINPTEIFTALEEHFSLLKSEAARVDPLGITNNDKIEMHGFDTKDSFRGR